MRPVWWPLLTVGMVTLVSGSGSFSGSRSHSLVAFLTIMSEPVQELPQFVAVMKLDGVIGGKYDSHTRKITVLTPWAKEAEKIMPYYFAWLLVRAEREEKAMRSELENVQKQHNHSTGIHIWQAIYGCELSEDEETSHVYNQYSYDGRDFLSFDAETLTWTADDVQAQMVKRIWDADLGRSQKLKAELEGDCTKLLWNLLKYGKEILLRKDAPTVKVSRAVGYNGLETLVCRVDGFYPKEIDATWRRDGQVWEQDTFCGDVVPNSDGTYHTSLHVEVDPKEEAHYQCHVEHDALTEPLDVAWEEPASTPVALIVVGVIIVLAALLIVLVLVYIRKRCRRRHQARALGNPDPDSHAQACVLQPLREESRNSQIGNS